MLRIMNQHRIPLRPDPAALRQRGTTTLVRAAAAYLIANTRRSSAAAEATSLWPDDRDLHLLMKAVAEPATTTDANWASVLAQSALADFILSLGPASAGAALLSRGLSLQFDRNHAIVVPGCVASGGNTSFVRQGLPIPVRQLSFDGAVLSPRKFATLCVLSREIASHSTSIIEKLTRAVLSESVSLALDAALFDDAPGDDTRPPGLRNGIAPQISSVLADPLQAMLADIKTLAVAVGPVAGNGAIILVANLAQAASLRSWPQRIGYEVMASSGVAVGDLIAVAPNAVTSAIDPLPNFSIAKSATLHTETAPTTLSAVATPNTVAAPVRSLWQTDTVGLRLIMDVAWGLRSTSGLAWLNGVNW